MSAWNAIAAMARNRVIGHDNRIPWRIPGDFRWFKQTTLGGILVMGRRTFESIGRPLPGRETFILSRSGYSAVGTRTFSEPAGIVAATASDPRTVWVCGGADIYRQLLPYCAELYLTMVEAEPEGDAWFPPFEDLFEDAGEVLREEGFTVRRYRNPAPQPLPTAV